MAANRPNYRQERAAQARKELALVPTIPLDCHKAIHEKGEHSLTLDQELRASAAIWEAALQLRMKRPELKPDEVEIREYITVQVNGNLTGVVAR